MNTKTLIITVVVLLIVAGILYKHRNFLFNQGVPMGDTDSPTKAAPSIAELVAMGYSNDEARQISAKISQGIEVNY